MHTMGRTQEGNPERFLHNGLVALGRRRAARAGLLAPVRTTMKRSAGSAQRSGGGPAPKRRCGPRPEPACPGGCYCAPESAHHESDKLIR